MCVITAAEPASASASASASSFWWLALRWLCGLDSAADDEHTRAVAAASGKADGEADWETERGRDGGRGEDAGLEYVKRERANDRAAGWRARAAHCAVNAGAVLMLAYYVFLNVLFE